MPAGRLSGYLHGDDDCVISLCLGTVFLVTVPSSTQLVFCGVDCFFHKGVNIIDERN